MENTTTNNKISYLKTDDNKIITPTEKKNETKT